MNRLKASTCRNDAAGVFYWDPGAVGMAARLVGCEAVTEGSASCGSLGGQAVQHL